MSNQIKDVCLQELERLNKEIETVRNEVEQEQRRLSRFQTVQTDRNAGSELPVSKSEKASKSLDRDTHGLSSCTDLIKTSCHVRKYVVDNSKPRTDLEYDPLSNFSADLRSYSSSGKEQQVKNGQGLKRSRNAGSCDQKKPATHQPQLSQSPEPLDDVTEDDVLIIDFPFSPDEKRTQVQKSLDHVSGKPLKDKVEELKVVQALLYDPPLHPAKPETCKTASPSGAVQENRISAKCAENLSNLQDSRECESRPAGGSLDLERESQKVAHFQAVETEVKKSPEPASPSPFRDLRVEKAKSTSGQVKVPHCELPQSVEVMNPLQPYHFLPKNSLFYKAPAFKSDSQGKQHTKQDQTTELPVQSRVGNQQSFMNVPSMVPHNPKTFCKGAGQTRSKATPPESCLERLSGCSRNQVPQNFSASGLTGGAESASSEQKVDNNVVVIDSSSDDDDNGLSYSEMGLSDSDPMEECYRIFMEENEAKGNEQPNSSVSMLQTLQI